MNRKAVNCETTSGAQIHTYIIRVHKKEVREGRIKKTFEKMKFKIFTNLMKTTN